MFEYLVFIERESLMLSEREIRIEIDGEKLRYQMVDSWDREIAPRRQEGVFEGDVADFLERLEAFDIPSWKDEYYIPACDGYGWELRYKEVAKPCRNISGSNDCPDCYDDFVDLLFSVAYKRKEEMWS